MRVSLALVLGLACGMALPGSASPPEWASTLEGALDVVGTAWINAVRMSVIPLVVPLLIVGVAGGSDAREAGRLGARAFAWMLGLAVVCAIGSALVAPAWFQALTLDPDATARLRASARLDLPPAEALSLRSWFLGLIPLNPVRAAADGALLPVVLFTLLYAFALARVEAEGRAAQLRFFRGMADTMLVVVRWILALGWLGIFALAVVLGRKLGVAVLGAMGFYLVVMVALHLAAVAGIYAYVAVARPVPLRAFARALLPSQAVAMGTRSSLAALPAMVRGATDVLGLPAAATGFVLPLCASVFKLTSPVYWPVGALFVAKLYGLDLPASSLWLVAASAVALNFSTPGIPSGGILLQVPLYTAIGLPVEGLGILIALDTFPDMFKTLLNVTADMLVAVTSVPPGSGTASGGQDGEPGAVAVEG